MPVSGAARGRHIRSRLERLNKRIARIVAYQQGAITATTGDGAYTHSTFRAARAALKLIPRQVRLDYNTWERERIARERENRALTQKAKINSELPAALHAGTKARKEERKRRTARRER